MRFKVARRRRSSRARHRRRPRTSPELDDQPAPRSGSGGLPLRVPEGGSRRRASLDPKVAGSLNCGTRRMRGLRPAEVQLPPPLIILRDTHAPPFPRRRISIVLFFLSGSLTSDVFVVQLSAETLPNVQIVGGAHREIVVNRALSVEADAGAANRVPPPRRLETSSFSRRDDLRQPARKREWCSLRLAARSGRRHRTRHRFDGEKSQVLQARRERPRRRRGIRAPRRRQRRGDRTEQHRGDDDRCDVW